MIFCLTQVFAKDVDNRERMITQPFSMDGSRGPFGLLPRIALMTNASFIVSTTRNN